ncbi:glucose-6-phosphate isomerase [Patescibacteria group bacterium]|nr:glucose-6-phosphate isomerase [Patescibacteria group bacterium]
MLKNKKQEIENRKPDIRCLNDMRKVIYDQEWLKTAPNLELYYMYRGIKKKDGLRYDITVIPARMLGKEFVRTKGNRNSEGYQELYTVLKGEAIFLMQKVQGEIVKDVIITTAKPGNWVVVPPDYAVITINPSKRVLKTGNWVSEKTKNIYRDIEKMGGACYFYTQSGWMKNKNYTKVPKLRFEKPFKSMPKNLDFLKGGRGGTGRRR